MLDKFKKHFSSSQKPQTQAVKKEDVLSWEFAENIALIRGFVKNLRFSDAIMASRELSLRVKTELTYQESLLKKLYSLEASTNAPEVAEKIAEKMQQARKLILVCNKRTALLKEFLHEIEKAKTKTEKRKTALENSFLNNPFLLDVKDRYHAWRQKAEKSAEVSSYYEAVGWIEKCLKNRQFQDALQGVTEMISKNDKALVICGEIKGKILTLESSNIKDMEERARLKKKEILAKERSLLERKDQLSRLQERTEETFSAFTRKEQERKVKTAVGSQVQAVEEFLKKKDFAQAYMMAKKSVNEFPGNEVILKQFLKAQKLLEVEKERKKNLEEKKNKHSKLLKEMGLDIEEFNEDEENLSFGQQFKKKFFMISTQWKSVQEAKKRKQTLGEVERLLMRAGSIEKVNLSIEQQSALFSSVRKEVIKDMTGGFDMQGFEVFGKSIGAESIIGDAFGHHTYEDGRTVIYFGDAMGHGIQAGFTTALLTKGFLEHVKKISVMQDLVHVINNELKEKIKGKSFITAMFLEWNPATGMLSQTGAGHPPLLIYRKKLGVIEQIRSFGLPLGVRIINNQDSIKMKEVALAEGDIFLGYTDGITEAKNPAGEMYGLPRLEALFLKYAKMSSDPKAIYTGIIEEVTKQFAAGQPLGDDASVFIFTRSQKKDVVVDANEFEKILDEQGMSASQWKGKYKNKTKEDLLEEIKKQQKKQGIQTRLDRLRELYKLGEFLKMKQEITAYYREGFVHPKMQFYLGKIIEYEESYNVRKLEDKLQKKYNTLMDLYNRGKYDIVIKETMEIITKNGKI